MHFSGYASSASDPAAFMASRQKFREDKDLKVDNGVLEQIAQGIIAKREKDFGYKPGELSGYESIAKEMEEKAKTATGQLKEIYQNNAHTVRRTAIALSGYDQKAVGEAISKNKFTNEGRQQLVGLLGQMSAQQKQGTLEKELATQYGEIIPLKSHKIGEDQEAFFGLATDWAMTKKTGQYDQFKKKYATLVDPKGK